MDGPPTAQPEPASGQTTRPDLSALRMNRHTAQTPGVVRRPRRAVRPWMIALVMLAVLLAGAWLLPLPWLLPRVETTSAQVITPTQASTVLTATGYTYARTRAAVGAKIIGRVVELRVDEGDAVKAGDVIAVLDSDDLKAAVREAEARVAEAQAQVADAQREAGRQQGLLDSGVGAQANYDAASTRLDVTRAQLGTAEAALAAARARLTYTVVTAPISGVIVDKNIEVGEMVAPGGFTSQQSSGSIVRIADLGSLEVEADINESYIARLKLGQPATIGVDAVPGVSYHGRLRQIVPTADRQRAVVQVKVTIDDRDARLVPDMSSTVTFLEEGTRTEQLAAQAKIVVTRSAVRMEGQDAFVFVVQGGRLRKLAVTVGAAAGDQVEVLSGLRGGETIVQVNLESLRDGRRVRT